VCSRRARKKNNSLRCAGQPVPQIEASREDKTLLHIDPRFGTHSILHLLTVTVKRFVHLRTEFIHNE